MRPWAVAAPVLLALAAGAHSGAAQSRDIAPRPDTPPAGRPLYADSWAVVVGINDYRHERVPKLRYAVNDARSVEAALLAQGFRRERITVLTDQQATKARIEEALGDRLRQQAGREDRVLVFFAGHGMTVRLRTGDEEGYLIPVDGDPARLFSTAISMSALRQISDLLPAKHVLYIVDACYSGYAVYNRAVADDLFEEMVKKPAIQILTAGRQGDQAQERAGHGVFTDVLLRGLSGEAFTGKGWVALDQLGAWVRERVYAESNKKQVPQFGNLSGDGQFVFVRPAALAVRPPPAAEPPKPNVSEELRPERGSLVVSAPLAGVEVWLGEQKLGETRAGRVLVVSDLPAGVHRLRAVKVGYRPWERDVPVGPNARVEVTITLEPRSETPAAGAGAVAALPAPSTPAPGGVVKRLGIDAAPMVFVPDGPFVMGAGDDDPRASSVEKPQRTIRLSGFWIDQFEVTNAQYKAFRDAARHRAPSTARDPRFGGASQPVVGVSWEDAEAYCRWAGKRLPTEAEWEKAARGTDGRLFPWGGARADGAGLAHAGRTQTADIGTYPMGASPYGAHDMAGNVWEWVQDWYDPGFYRKDPAGANPKGPALGGEKVLRGGSWWERDSASLRVTARHHQPPERTHNNVGFRCALTGTGDAGR